MTKPHYCRKCPTKPKAHWWMFKPQGSPDVGTATCKYCGKSRTFTHVGPYDMLNVGDVHNKALSNAFGGTRGMIRLVRGEKI